MAKIGKHIPSDFSMSTTSLMKNIENELDVYRDRDWMKKFLNRPGTMKILNFDVINKRAAGIV